MGDLGDMFGAFFGGATGGEQGFGFDFRGHGGGRKSSNKGSDLRFKIKLDFMESMEEGEYEIKVKRDKACEKCKGNGRIQNTKKIMVDIPAGLRDGMGIRLAGAAGRGTNGAPNGDILVKVSMRYPTASELTEEQISLLKDI